MPNFKTLLYEVSGVKTDISTHGRLSKFASLQTLLVEDEPTLRYTRAGLTKLQPSREVMWPSVTRIVSVKQFNKHEIEGL